MTQEIEIIRLQVKGVAVRFLQQILPPAAVAIGNFDGVHLGHQAVLKTMCDYAKKHGLVPAALSFYPHPRYYFKPDMAPFLLQNYKSRIACLRDFGVRRLYLGCFNAAMAHTSAEDFCDMILAKACQARAIFTGENFAFGAARRGDTASLQRWAEKENIHAHAVKAVGIDAQICSSSAIRAALHAGDMAHVARMLGRDYRVEGSVRAGDGRGRQIGFPTANIFFKQYQMVPAYGVYVVAARDAAGTCYRGVANLGVRPTFGGDSRPRLEVHLFDVERNFLGEHLQVDMKYFIRPEQRFDGVQSLIAQIQKDVTVARDYWGRQEAKPSILQGGV